MSKTTTPPSETLPPVIMPAEYDEDAARAAIAEIAEIPRDPDNATPEGHVIDRHMRMLLDLDMPIEAYAVGMESGYPYVPGMIIDHAARAFFGDMWDTDVLSTDVVHQGQRMLPSANPGRREANRVHFVVATATVRVTLRGENGNRQCHTGVGVASYQVPVEDPHIERAYQIAIKGAVIDGRRKALELFGNFFNVRTQNPENLLETIRQRAPENIAQEGAEDPFQNEPAEENASYVLKIGGEILLPFQTGKEFVEAWIATLKETASIKEMEAFISANAEVLKSIDTDGIDGLLASIPGLIDQQYLGLSADEEQEREIGEKTGAKPAQSATEETGGETEEDKGDAGKKESNPYLIPFKLNKDNKIARASAYIKSFLAKIEGAQDRKELERIMDSNQENLGLLPKKHLSAINDIAKARARKSSEYPA